MLKLLIRKQMGEIFRAYFYDAKKNRARSKTATAAYIVLFIGVMAGVLGGLFTYVALSLCGPMTAAGADWLYFAVMGLLSILMGTFGSVFNTYASLYLARDNDLLLSLPIPPGVIMASRLLSVYLMGLMYSAVTLLPALAVYWCTARHTAAAVAGGLLFMALISVFVLTLSCALGWVAAKISLKLKNKSFITVVVSLAAIAAYYFVDYTAQTLLQTLAANAAAYGERIRGTAAALYLFGLAATGSAPALLGLAAVTLGVFALMWRLMARSFLKLATSTGRTARRVYRETAMKRGGVRSALLGRELGRFASSPGYMLNCGLGTLGLLAGAVLLLWRGGTLVRMLEGVFEYRSGCVGVLLCTGVCAMAGMNVMTAPSVSLEGRNLWLVQSLPVTPWQVLRAKLSLQLLLTGVPALPCIAVMAFVRSWTLPELLTAALQPLSFVLFSALFGLFWGVKLPVLSWTDEITPIKQSACVALSMLGNLAYTALICAGYLLLPGWRLGFAGYMGGVTALTLALSAWLLLWLRSRGAQRFAAL